MVKLPTDLSGFSSRNKGLKLCKKRTFHTVIFDKLPARIYNV